MKVSKDSRQSRRSADEKLVALAGRNNTLNRSLKTLEEAPKLERDRTAALALVPNAGNTNINKLNKTSANAPNQTLDDQFVQENNRPGSSLSIPDGGQEPKLPQQLSQEQNEGRVSPELDPTDMLEFELAKYLDSLESNQSPLYSDNKPDPLPVHLSSLNQKSPTRSPNRAFADGAPNRARSKAPKPLPKPKSSSLNQHPAFSNASSPNRPQSSSPSPSALRK